MRIPARDEYGPAYDKNDQWGPDGRHSTVGPGRQASEQEEEILQASKEAEDP